MQMRRYSAAELYNFYITDQHWLHMDRNKMLLILIGIKKELNNLSGWQEAFDMVQNSTPDEIKERRLAYYRRYGQPHEIRQYNGRHKGLRAETVQYAEIVNAVNQN